ncbi:MAG: dihydroneopterin aldolase [Alcaligenaceae bacterium]|jgi:dihydroneopterin aldolase|nr:dihydroneopterin aldolase [Alcaligenaceae bacterium]
MNTITIFFERLAIEARVGVLPRELKNTQRIYIDAEISVQQTQHVDDLDIKSVLDYRLLRQAIIEECTRKHVHLVEALGQMIAARLLGDFNDVTAVKLRISKPSAFDDCDAVGIEFNLSR